ncbi:MAG TPA: HAMP domain-containing sensor histidine kinase [Polyangiaceae bacterium]|jgi:signal transduction histidine kinase
MTAHGLEEAQAEILSVVSHDIRAPLGVILVALSELVSPQLGPLTDEQRALLLLIRRSGERLSRLSTNVLYLNRARGGTIGRPRAAVDLRDVARRAFESLERSGELSKVDARLELPPERVEVAAEAESLVHAIANLLANAVRFARSSVRVRVSATPTPQVSVDDDGPGFVHEAVPLAFDAARLGQGESLAVHGLGLVVVKAIGDAHDATVKLETQRDARGEPRGGRVAMTWMKQGS